jgi:hypothetical protein
MKFRIIEYTHDVTNSTTKRIEFVVEKKNWLWGWEEIYNTELTSKRISHSTYKDAEAYMIKKYMGHGECKRVGVEYCYTPYTYYHG